MFRQNSKPIAVLILLAAVAIWLAACGGGNEPSTNSAPQTGQAPAGEAAANNGQETGENGAPADAGAEGEVVMTDAMGHEVNVPVNPQRIIASYLEDYLVALNVKPAAQWSVKNGSVQAYLQSELDGVPPVPHDLPYEVVAGFDPDLIILAENTEAEGDKYAQYSSIAPTFVLGDEVTDNWREALLKIGEILQKSEEAERVLAEYDAKANDAKERISETIGDQKVAAIWLVSKQFYVVSDNLSSGAVLYQDLGLAVPDTVAKISENGTGNWNAISLEELASLDVDHLFLINSDQSQGSEMLKEPLWQGIPAVKNGHIYEFPSTSSWLYGGPIANSQIIDDVLGSLVQ